MISTIFKYLLNNGKNLLFHLLCWILGTIILIRGYINIDFNKPNEIPSIFLFLSAIGLLLLLLPFFRRIKIGDVELEREVEQTKKELTEFKGEIRNTISVMSTQISTVANIKNQVIVYVTGSDEAKNDLKQIPQNVEKEARSFEDDLYLRNQDLSMGMFRISNQIENLLNKIINKRLSMEGATIDIRPKAPITLTREFIKYYPQFTYLQSSLEFLSEIRNVTAHGQQISEYQAKDVIDIGAKLIAALKNIATQEGVI